MPAVTSPPDQDPNSRAQAFALRMAQAMEHAWWKGQTALVAATDEPLAVVAPKSGAAAGELVLLGQRLRNWQQANACARHIWGLDDLLAGRPPRTPPVYLTVSYPLDRLAECYEPVALVFVAAATDHKAAIESLSDTLGEMRARLAWFADPENYGYSQR
jgi:hypothetical protein